MRSLKVNKSEKGLQTNKRKITDTTHDTESLLANLNNVKPKEDVENMLEGEKPDIQT